MRIPLALLWFSIGFVLANGLKMLHIFLSVKKMQKQTGYMNQKTADFQKKAYKKSLPYTPVYYLIVWLLCSTFYFSQHTAVHVFSDGLLTGILWWLLTLLLEMLLWIIARHRMQLSWKEMYMESQPWLSVSYYAVLISPLILSMIIAF